MPRLAVLGQPVAHSRSPAMQTAALERLGLADLWSYEAIEVDPDNFATLVSELPERGFAGVNVTVPHKLAALEVADDASPAANEIGAANTLTFGEGRVRAANTDADAIIDALPRSPDGARALVMGAGGAARAAVWALKRAGADVAIWNRTPERANRLAHDLGATPVPSYELRATSYDVLLNATTVGLRPTAASIPDRGSDLKRLYLDADCLNGRQIVVDLVYGPVETELAAAARGAGATVVDGIEVLVRQGAASLRLWTNAEPPIETMRAAARGFDGNNRQASRISQARPDHRGGRGRNG